MHKLGIQKCKGKEYMGMGWKILLSTSHQYATRICRWRFAFTGQTGTRWSTSPRLTGPSLQCINARVNSYSLVSRGSYALSKGAPAVGILEDGRKYIRVPFLLFSDDFTSMGGRGGSFGGCYLAPMLCRANRRRSMSSVRVLGLTPPGVSSNGVIRNVVDDIVECSTTGVEVLMDSGEKMVMFIEVVAFIGDYPGMSHCLDVVGQMGNSPCTHCTFKRADLRYEEESSRYCYTSAINSADPAFRRTKQGMRAIRTAEKYSRDDLPHAGLRDLSQESLNALPLHVLSDKLEAARSLDLKTREGVPVTHASFDPYQSCAVAPSHVLYGLAQNILHTTIRICTPNERKHADQLMFDVLSHSGLISEHNIIQLDTLKLHNMTISNTFSVFLVAPWAFNVAMKLDLPYYAASKMKQDT